MCCREYCFRKSLFLQAVAERFLSFFQPENLPVDGFGGIFNHFRTLFFHIANSNPAFSSNLLQLIEKNN